jgi:TrmH family RNA methyltransferase
MITSTQNLKIKKINQLLTKSKIRKKERLFIVEGKKIIDEINCSRIWEIYISNTFLEKHESYVNKLYKSNIQVEIVSDTVMKHISSSVTPQGIIGLIKIVDTQVSTIINKNSFIIMLENIQDPGNLGTIIRTADAVKASGIILSKGSVDVFNPKVVRATMGSIFRVPIIQDRNLIDDISKIREHNVEILASHLKGSTNIYNCDLTRGICVLIGNEGNGLTEQIANLADKNIKIPMIGESESLNAGVATSIIAYESLRQRNYK